MGEQARGYSWPAFPPGHTLSMRHGARSARTVRPIAEAVAAQLVEVAPWCARPAFHAEVEAWAWQEARCRLLREWLDEVGLLDDEGVPRPACSELARAESAAARGREALGLNPRAWAKLFQAFSGAAVDTEADLAELRRVGREALALRAAELDGGSTT